MIDDRGKIFETQIDVLKSSEWRELAPSVRFVGIDWASEYHHVRLIDSARQAPR
jgi:hypothetical protein